MGTKKLEQFEQQLDANLQDAAKLLPPGDKDRVIAQALDVYSGDRPLRKKFDFAGNGATFDVPTPADWLADFSNVLSLEYPADEREPVMLEQSDSLVYRKTDGSEVVRLVSITPQAGKTLRVEYSLKHTPPTGEAATSATDADFFAICHLAAHFAFLELAARATQKRDPSMSADSVDRQAQAEGYLALARLRRKDYEKLLGLDKDSSPRAGSAMTDLDTESQAGTDRLTHPGRLR